MKTFRLLLLLIIYSTFCFSQDGTLDISFDEDGVVSTDFYNSSDEANSVAVQNDGKIVAVGRIDLNNLYQPAISRYNYDGSLDLTFGDNGKIIQNLGAGVNSYNSILALENGEIIVGGTINVWDEKDFLISKYLSNGTLDSSFGTNGNVITDFFNETDIFSNLLLQNNGKFIAVGNAKNNSISEIVMSRYNLDGSLDTTFGINGIVSTNINDESITIYSSALLIDEKILILFKAGNQLKLIQYLPNGDIDSSFGENGIITISNSSIYRSCLTVNNIGEIIIAYSFNFPYSTYLSKYFPNGDLDTSYGINGSLDITRDYFFVSKILIQEDQKLLIYGKITEFEGTEFTLARYFKDGDLDLSFGDNGFVYQSFESSDVVLQDDGKIVGVGNTYWYEGPEDFVLVRYNNTPLSVSDFNLNSISIYPNPSKNIFTIKHDLINDEISYKVSDVVGKIILSGNMGAIQTNIDLSQMQSGMYFLNIQNKTYRLLKN